jgi:hypothetical protein
MIINRSLVNSAYLAVLLIQFPLVDFTSRSTYITYSSFTPGSRVSLGYIRLSCSTLGRHLSLLSCRLGKASAVLLCSSIILILELLPSHCRALSRSLSVDFGPLLWNLSITYSSCVCLLLFGGRSLLNLAEISDSPVVHVPTTWAFREYILEVALRSFGPWNLLKVQCDQGVVTGQGLDSQGTACWPISSWRSFSHVVALCHAGT